MADETRASLINSLDSNVTVIHRDIGLGKDLEWLKDIQAQQILLITRDSQQQRRLRLQLLKDNRFLVLTEDQAANAQIQSLQQQRDELEQKLKPLKEKVLEAEKDIPELQQQNSTLERENERLRLENVSLTKQIKTMEIQVELFSDLLNKEENAFEPEK